MLSSTFRTLARAAILFALTSTAAFAQKTINIPADYPTIQGGINAASNGDTVLIAPGTYFENIDFKGKAITVTSSGGAAQTIIDGGGKASTVAMTSGETAASILSNLTITHGGGSRSNFGIGGQGGVEIANGMPTVLNNVITQNYCQGISVNSAAPLIKGNVVSSSLTPDKCDVLETGGIFLGNPYVITTYPFGYVSPTIVGNTIENNTTGQQGDGGGDGGAGIAVWGGTPLIQNNIIRNNKTGTGSGGGINIVFGNSVSIIQNLIYGNSAGCGGGAIGFSGGGGFGLPTLIVADNTIVDNLGGTNPAYSDCARSAQLWSSFDHSGPTDLFVNNIISGATSFPAFVCGSPNYSDPQQPSEGYQALFDHNVLYNGGQPFFGSYCVDTSNLHNNVSADPQFVDPANGDFHLKVTSPAVDAGNGSFLQELMTLRGVVLTTDFNNQPREQDATGKGTPIIDMGAYEFGGTVDTAPTRIVLSPSAYTGTAGSNYTLTATLSSALGAPTGAVTFFLDAQQIGVSSANNGVAILNSVAFTPGVHVLYATYAGQGSFPPAVSLVVVILIDRYSTNLSITSAPNPSFIGQSVTFTIQTSSADPNYIPTPITLTDYLSNTLLATLIPDSAGAATYTTSSLSVGFHDIYATYAGDSTHNGSSADARQTVLDPNSTTITASSSSNPSILGQNVTFTVAVVSAGGTVPTGSITFSDGSLPLGSAILDAAGRTTLSTTALAVGPHTININYVPTGTFEASTATLYQQVITGYATSTTLTSSLNPSVTGQTVTFTAAVTSTNGIPAGTIQFSDGTTVLAIQPLSPTGVATFATSALTIGVHNITAAYVPTGSFAGSSTSISQTVNAITNTVNVNSSLNPSTYGQAVTITARVSSNIGTALTGSVAFYDGNFLATVPLDPSGNAAYTTSSFTVGGHLITAVFTPTGSTTTYTGSYTQQVNGLASSTLLTANPTSGIGQVTPVSLTATVAPAVTANTTLTGSVIFYLNGTQLATVALANGAATYTGTLPAGVNQLYANYAGDPNRVYSSSISNTITVTMSATPTTLTLASSAPTSPALVPVTFTAQLFANAGPATITGVPVIFTIDGKIAATVSTANQGIATLTTAALAPGAHTVTASFAGDLIHGPSAAAPLTESITPDATVTTVLPPLGTITQLDRVSPLAVVRSNYLSAVPTGSVTIFEGTTALATATLTPTTSLLSNAAILLNPLPPGTHILVAVYTPDTASFLPSQSVSFTLIVVPASFTLTLFDPTLTLQTGHHHADTVSLTSIGGLSGTFTLTCGTPLPTYTTCTLAQASVTLPVNGTVATSLTIDTDQLIGFLAQNHPDKSGAPFVARTLRHGWAATTLATLVPFALFGLRRRNKLRALLSLLLLATLAGTLTACGADKYPASTAPGTYVIPVTATGPPIPGGGSLTQTVKLTLVVTP